MKRFNIAYIVPDRNGPPSLMHGLYGYREVIDALQWGLTDIGCDTTVRENGFIAERTNIVLGAQMLTDSELQRLPRETIIYNFEQIGRLQPDSLKPEIRTVVDRFRIWDYSAANLETWKTLGAASSAVHVAVGWAPILRRIDKPSTQDIDVLIYALPAQLRLDVFNELCHRGLRCVFVCGMYGAERDALIRRSKLVLNINSYQSRIFEIVRVSYLLANAKAVIADFQADTVLEPGIEGAVVFSAPEQIVATCMRLAADDDARGQQEETGCTIFERRHISPILREALERTESLTHGVG
jgi:hypothetical protein